MPQLIGILSQWALLEGMERTWTPIVTDWRLNERHYGALTGLSKAAAIETYGVDAVQLWRRSFDIAPPPASDGQQDALIDERYARIPPNAIPHGESLAHVVHRLRPMWEDLITPGLLSGQRILVTGHGNSLRALTMLIEAIPEDDITQVEVVNAIPVVYTLDGSLNVINKKSLGTSTALPSEIL